MGLAHKNCGISTSIADFLTFGMGRLDENGFWEYPCYDCARAHEKEHPEDFPCWPFSVEYLNHLKKEKKWPFDKEETSNKIKCDKCGKEKSPEDIISFSQVAGITPVEHICLDCEKEETK